uniref:Putative Response regulator receiver protein n=1 Tax=Magnetococcus massalia (strain MO-1) TaxID=451514 RepID=A0A1S7LF77_MAGMO|nr:putative Response regulator receiver protein [Candidatus Magnetococcus massalia]
MGVDTMWGPYTVLCIDDMPQNLAILQRILEGTYQIVSHTSPEKAVELARRHRPHAIILDIMMPGLTGFDICKRLKELPETAKIPVIFLTSRVDHEAMVQGLKLGAYHYLNKPADHAVLHTILQAAIREYETQRALHDELHHMRNTINLLHNGEFRIRDLDQAYHLSALIAKACPEPDKQVTGLREMMVNAVEHGNLGITYDEKSRLIQDGTLGKEIERRLALPENADKCVSINLEQSDDKVEILIKDDGRGFDWQPYLRFAPERVSHSHGRGIALSNLESFDIIEYRGCGNEVLLVANKLEREPRRIEDYIS